MSGPARALERLVAGECDLQARRPGRHFEARWEAAYYAVRARMAGRSDLRGNVFPSRGIQSIQDPNANICRRPTS